MFNLEDAVTGRGELKAAVDKPGVKQLIADLRLVYEPVAVFVHFNFELKDRTDQPCTLLAIYAKKLVQLRFLFDLADVLEEKVDLKGSHIFIEEGLRKYLCDFDPESLVLDRICRLSQRILRSRSLKLLKTLTQKFFYRSYFLVRIYRLDFFTFRNDHFL